MWICSVADRSQTIRKRRPMRRLSPNPRMNLGGQVGAKRVEAGEIIEKPIDAAATPASLALDARAGAAGVFAEAFSFAEPTLRNAVPADVEEGGIPSHEDETDNREELCALHGELSLRSPAEAARSRSLTCSVPRGSRAFRLNSDAVELNTSGWLRGSMATGTLRATGQQVAVKKIPSSNCAERERLEANVSMLMGNCCAAIVCYHGILTQTTDVWCGRPEPTFQIVMEFMDLGGLHLLMEQACRCGSAQVAYIARSVTTALSFLHERGLTHKRVRPENIVLNSRGEVKLTGVFLQEEDIDCCMAFPLRVYLAPERCLGEDCTGGTAGDVWSLGLVLYELATGTFPYEGSSIPQLFDMITEQPEPRLDTGNHGTPICDFLAQCLTRAIVLQPQEVQTRSSVGADTACTTVAHVSISSLSGEILGLKPFAQPVLVKELSDIVRGMTGLITFELVLDGRILHPEESISGGTPEAPLGLTCVATTVPWVRATARQLLGHRFCRVGVPTQGDFAHWLQELAQ
mmetsp:Transcript_86253/g.171259  ORF Transcript_86253/g.171259 Transcript_86253/m.171259 type:complete len:518 (+) Transcript_86253:128-1681(+)